MKLLALICAFLAFARCIGWDRLYRPGIKPAKTLAPRLLLLVETEREAWFARAEAN